MLTAVTITYDIADLVGVDFDARRTKVYVTTNVDSVIDTVGNQIRVGDGLGTLAADGTGSISVWVPGAGSNPATWQTYVHIDYAPRSPGAKRETLTYGPFTITTAGDLADLVADQIAIPTATAAEWAAAADASADAAATSAGSAATSATASATSATASAASATASQAARTGAEAAAALAEDISNIATPDALVETLIENPASLTSAALSATIVGESAKITDVSTGNDLTKYGVVIERGPDGAFDEMAVESLIMAFDPTEGRWAAVYTGYGEDTGALRASVGLAYTSDGLHFEKIGQLFAYNGTDEAGHTGPVLIRVGDTWHLFTIMLDGAGYEGGNKVIRRASTTATLLEAQANHSLWTRHGTVMAKGGTAWRQDAVWHPNFVQVGDTWYCFLNAAGTVNGVGGEYIGYATAPSITGPWTFDDVNSPLIAHLPGFTIDGDPFVTKIPGGWRMDFFRSGTTAGDFYATTTDALFPLGWVDGNNGEPILVGTPGTYDAVAAHKPSIYKIGGRLHHYYTAWSEDGTDHGNRVAALATDPPVAASFHDVTLGGGTLEAKVNSILAALAAQGATVDNAIFRDRFDRANGALGAPWVTSGSGWAVDDNEAQFTGAGDTVAAVDTGLADNYSIEFTVREAVGPGFYPFAVLARGSSISSFVKIVRLGGGVRWSLNDGTTGTDGNLNTDHPVVGDIIRVEVDGTTYRLYRNGVLQDTWTGVTAHNTGADTFQGLVGTGGQPWRMDDFSVTPL